MARLAPSKKKILKDLSHEKVCEIASGFAAKFATSPHVRQWITETMANTRRDPSRIWPREFLEKVAKSHIGEELEALL